MTRPPRAHSKTARSLSRAARALFAAALALALASACGSSGSSSTDPNGGNSGASSGADGNGDAGAPNTGTAGSAASSSLGGGPEIQGDAGQGGEAAAPSTPLLPACQAVYTSCDSHCGPVHDPCTGDNFDCGACATGMACDRDTHTCATPKLTCQELGAECGKIRNTCGERLDCGDCLAGQECDPDTNKCTACSNPTCKDLGFECGAAWLGCGSHLQSTNCGDCAAGSVCNPSYNRCEPAPPVAGGTCIPKSTKDLCAAQSAECGYISNGCGDTVKCGDCALGLSCGTNGIANRCGPPEPGNCRCSGTPGPSPAWPGRGR